MTTPGPQPFLRERTGLRAARLAARHSGCFAEETVRVLIADSHQRLAATATVATHLGVLAEHLAAERLDTLIAAPTSTPTTVDPT